jgi:DHA2 family multidrug resistance protein-like MFS transporter
MFVSLLDVNIAPLMDLTLLKNRTFSIILLANMAATAMLSMNNFIIPFYITGHHRLSPENTGLTILAFSAVYGIFSPFVGKLAERIPPGRLCITGTLFMLVSACWFLFYLDSSSLFHVFVLLAGFGIGFALFISPANILALGMADRSNAGSLTAMFRTTRQLASLLGIVVVGILTRGMPSGAMNFKPVFFAEIVLSFGCFCMLSLFFVNTHKEHSLG